MTGVQTCALPISTEHESRLEQLHPKRNEQRRMFDEKVSDFVNRYSQNKTMMPGGINIPVVVHVVYKNAAQNISNAQIQSQIDVLNLDFNHLNADTANTPSVFQPIAGNAGINFCLAQIDPNGNATTGIERFQTTVNSFIDDDAVKAGATGGLDAWDPSQYFNIWVCNLGGGDRKSTRLNSSHIPLSRMPSSA